MNSPAEPPAPLDYDATLREVSTDLGTLRYHEAGDGPPLLLLHGSGPGVSAWRNYRHNMPRFAQHFRCLALEFPGFGVSDSTEMHPLLAAVPAVEQFLDALGLEQVDLIGNSMGGVVGLRFALAHPERVRRIVTVGGIGRNLFSPAPGEGLNTLSRFVEEPTRDNLLLWLRSMVFNPDVITEELIEERMALALDPDALASARRMYGTKAMAAMSAMADASPEPPYWAMLHQLRSRVLITWGRDDRVSPLDMMLVPMRTIRDVEVHVFPNCGHWTMVEAKSAWEATVLAFLTRVD